MARRGHFDETGDQKNAHPECDELMTTGWASVVTQNVFQSAMTIEDCRKVRPLRWSE